MDTNGDRATYIIGDHEENRDLVSQSTMAENTEFRERLRDSPKPVKSRADIILTEIEKQLEETESEYVSAMERLHYSRMLYDSAGSMSLGSNDYNKNDQSEMIEKTSQSDNSSGSHLVDDKISENNLASGDTPYLRETKNRRHNEQTEIEQTVQSPVYTARSFKVTSGTNIFHDVHDENSNDSDAQNYYAERAGDENPNVFYGSIKNRANNDADHLRQEHIINDISTRMQHPYQLHLAEYSKGLQDELAEEFRISEIPTTEDREIYPSVLKSSRQQDTKKPELRLNLSGSLESLVTSRKNKKKSRQDKQRRVSSKIVTKSIDETIGVTSRKKRKRREGLKTSTSRCTTATRDTNLSENKKDFRKQKQRAHSTIPGLQSSRNRRREVPPKNINPAMSEVVEIYHNSAVKSGSISVVSSKHSKLMDPRGRGFNTSSKYDQPSKTKGNYELVEANYGDKRTCEDIEERGSVKEKNDEIERSIKNGDNDEACRENFEKFLDLRSGEPNVTIYEAECSAEKSENQVIQDYEDRHHRQHNFLSPNNSFPCDDNPSTRNYQLPTVASKMKRVHRSYFNRFYIRNIPFVVGTSVTPSYNLGLNIQEVLSLMKSRQIMHAEVSPLLINNVTKGLRPVSTLLGCIKDEDEALVEGAGIPYGANPPGLSSAYNGNLIGGTMSKSIRLGPFPIKTPRLSCLHESQKLYESHQSCNDTKIEPTFKKQKARSICSSMKFNQQKTFELKPELTQSILLRQRREELNIGESQSMKWQNVNQSSKGIREVLKNFHDQYEAMITKFEKLQEQATNSSDKTLEQEIASLEKELNAKEEEINAVMSLHQEVMLLKDQMRTLHERNSLVCVATESPGCPTYPHFSIRSQTANPARMINIYKRGGSTNNQGPLASTRLAGLLRQIKTFQKQLKSTA